MRASILILALLSDVAAFSVTGSPKTARELPCATARLSLMSEEKADALLSEATDCVQGECSVDQVDHLIQSLQRQQRELYDRVRKLRAMIASLEVVNNMGEYRSVREVRETIRAIMRVFAIRPSHSWKPAGYSGDLYKDHKTRTAWDVLPPKKWSPTSTPSIDELTP